MKKRFLIFPLLFLLAFATVIPSFATTFPAVYVRNDGNALTDSEQSALQSFAEQAGEATGISIGILFVSDDMSQGDLRDLADYFFDSYCYSYTDAIILAVDISSRNYFIRTKNRMNDNLKDSAFDRIENATVSELSSNDWYGAGVTFVREISNLDESDFRQKGELSGELLFAEFIALLVCIGLGFGIAWIFARKMNNARQGRTATNYVRDGSFSLDKQADLYLYSTVTKVRVESNSSGGGGSHHSSSGGRGGHF